jgi:hypothetical protein
MLYKNINIIINIIDLTITYKKNIVKYYKIRSDIIQNLNNENIRIFGVIRS